jgi:hypothetical protein
MKRMTMTHATLLALAAVLVATLAGCGGASETPRPKASKTAGVSANPSTSARLDPLSGKSWTLESSSQTYDAQLGGIYQAVGIEAFESGTVRLKWVASDGASGTTPMARSKPGPGVLDVWLSDLRPHIDLMEPLEVPKGPIASVAFVAPADDALMILRITMRDISVTPVATIDVSRGAEAAGRIDVTVHD